MSGFHREQQQEDVDEENPQSKYLWLSEEHDALLVAQSQERSQQQQSASSSSSSDAVIFDVAAAAVAPVVFGTNSSFNDHNNHKHDDDNDDDDEEEAFGVWDVESKPLMGTGRLSLQDPSPSNTTTTSSSLSPLFGSQQPRQQSQQHQLTTTSATTPLLLLQESQQPSWLYDPSLDIAGTASRSGISSNYGSITPSEQADQDDVLEQRDNNATTTTATTAYSPVPQPQQQPQQQVAPHAEHLAPPQPTTLSKQDSESQQKQTQQLPPQRPCCLSIVYAFESFVVVISLSWWITEIFIPLVVYFVRSHHQIQQPTRDERISMVLEAVLMSYLGILVILLMLVESRQLILLHGCCCSWACCYRSGGILQSPMLQLPLYRGFWYSMVGCIGLNLAISNEYDGGYYSDYFQHNHSQQQQQQPQQAEYSSFENPSTSTSSSPTATSWEGWLFWPASSRRHDHENESILSSWLSWLQVVASALLMLVGWIYMIAGMTCFCCGPCLEQARTRHEEEVNQYYRQQQQQQQQQQQSKRGNTNKSKSK